MATILDRKIYGAIRRLVKHDALVRQHLRRLDTDPDYKERFEAETAKRLESEKAALKAERASEDGDYEFRVEVIDAMVAAGIARHVAAELTNTEVKLLAQAKKYNV